MTKKKVEVFENVAVRGGKKTMKIERFTIIERTIGPLFRADSLATQPWYVLTHPEEWQDAFLELNPERGERLETCDQKERILELWNQCYCTSD